MRYEDACKAVGYDRMANGPKAVFGYYAYKDGVGTEHASKEEASKVSKNVDRFVKNQNEIDAFRKNQRELCAKADELFNKDLREEYSHLNDEIYAIAYHEAYQRGHSAGHDEIANCMIDVVELIEKVMVACKK